MTATSALRRSARVWPPFVALVVWISWLAGHYRSPTRARHYHLHHRGSHSRRSHATIICHRSGSGRESRTVLRWHEQVAAETTRRGATAAAAAATAQGFFSAVGCEPRPRVATIHFRYTTRIYTSLRHHLVQRHTGHSVAVASHVAVVLLHPKFEVSTRRWPRCQCSTSTNACNADSRRFSTDQTQEAEVLA